MKEENKKPWKEKYERYITICKFAVLVITFAAVIVAILMNWKQTKEFIGQMFGILAPFFAALLIAYFVYPLTLRIKKILVRFVSKGKWDRGVKYISMLIAYTLVLTFLTLTVQFVVPQLIDSIKELIGNIPSMYGKVVVWVTSFQRKHPDLDLKFITEKLNEMAPTMVDMGTGIMTNAIPMVFNVSISLARVAINIILSIMISVYMVSGKRSFMYQLKRLIYAIFPEKKAESVCQTCRECNDIFSSFLISKAVDSLIIGCLCCIIMSILQLPYAVLISVFVGVTNMIPYFGPFIGAIPGVIIYLCTSPRDAIVFVIMVLILQQFDGLVLGPKLLGQSTGLSPLWVIFAITVGGGYFGVLGMFIGVPVVAVIAHLINKAIKARLQDKKIPALEAYTAEEKK